MLGSEVSSVLSVGWTSTSPGSSFGYYSNKKPRFHGDNSHKKRKTVSIHKSVSVIPIPSRYEYSQRTRELIWTGASEIHANAARNAIEFCSENWKWQNVLEDEQMFLHRGNGERVHPIHVHNALSLIDSFQAEGDANRNREEINFNLSLIAALVPPDSIQSFQSDILSRVYLQQHENEMSDSTPSTNVSPSSDVCTY
jgi:hypothetical protein